MREHLGLKELTDAWVFVCAVFSYCRLTRHSVNRFTFGGFDDASLS